MRFLLATPFLPEPPTFGATQRTHLLHRALAALGEVDLAVVKRHPRLTDDEEALLPTLPRVVATLGPVADATPPLWLRALAAFHSATAQRLLAERKALREYEFDPAFAAGRRTLLESRAYDVVVGRYLPPLCRIGALDSRSERTSPPAVLDFDDASHLYLEAQATNRHGLRLPLRARAKIGVHRRRVAERLARCAHVFFLSPAEQTHFPGVPGSVLPNIPFDEPGDDLAPPPPPPAHESSPLVLFVGLLTYPPNREGMQRFLARVWPAVRARVPAARVRLVGRVAAEDRAAWSAVSGVEVAGRVAELRPHYAAAHACIAPIYFGGGTNIKVVEAAQHARPIVVTPFSHYGFEHDLPDGECVLRADTDEAFAAHLTTLLTDSGRAELLGTNAHRAAQVHYSFDSFARIVREGIDAAVGEKR